MRFMNPFYLVTQLPFKEDILLFWNGWREWLRIAFFMGIILLTKGMSFQQFLLVKETLQRVNRFMNIFMYGRDQLLNWGAMTKYVLIRCDSSHSCVWWNTHRYRFVLLLDLIVAHQYLRDRDHCCHPKLTTPVGRSWHNECLISYHLNCTRSLKSYLAPFENLGLNS